MMRDITHWNRGPLLPLATGTALATALAAIASCGTDDGGSGSACGSLLAGDLVITEVMANPDGSDEGLEWFEIHNPTGEPIDLDGFRLVSSKADSTDAESHVIESLTVDPGGYVVVGSAAADALPGYVDYSYGSDLGTLNNTAGQLLVACDETVLDQVLYDLESETDPNSEGASRQLDGSVAPDAAANDDLTNWCDSNVPLDGESFGTPGEPNPACGSVPMSDCMDGDTMRAAVPPTPGDLVISEVHGNPDAVEDELGEYFEIYAKSAFDLNGLQIGEAEGDYDFVVQSESCLSVQADQYVLVAVNGDTAVNGGLPEADIDLMSGDFLNNSGGGLYVAMGDVLLDGVPDSGDLVGTGASANLSANMLDVDANDDPNNWCESMTPYGDGDLGTPKAANETCPGTVPDDQCEENGTLRAIKTPAVGDVVVTEFHANPMAVADADGEFVELYIANDIDLNGLKVFDSAAVVDEDPLFEAAECLPATAGTYILLAKESTANGGLPAVDAEFSFSLTNSGEAVFVAHGDTVIDELSYSGSTDGVSTGLDPAMLTATANDDEDNLCDQSTPYGDGDLGTPKAMNDACGGGGGDGMCNDNGTPRAIVSPTAGQVVINEVFANPDGSTEAQKEWFELYVTADVDLNDLTFSTTSSGGDSETITSADCLRFTAGSYVVIARNADPNMNAGVTTVDLEYPGALTLTNTSGDLSVSVDTTMLDTVNWNTSGVTDGRSYSLDPDFQNPTDNDMDAAWCDASDTDAYGAEDNAGTPGTGNPQCI